MSKPSEITSALVTLLQGSSHLTYIKQVLKGVRDSITQFPTIIIEPLGANEAEYAYPTERLMRQYAIMEYVNVTNKDLQIVGDTNTKGIDDLENDIKLALDSDRTLGGKAIFIHIKNTKTDFVYYPIRDVTIVVEVEFEQVRGTRA